jgi:hypothetical protein
MSTQTSINSLDCFKCLHQRLLIVCLKNVLNILNAPYISQLNKVVFKKITAFIYYPWKKSKAIEQFRQDFAARMNQKNFRNFGIIYEHCSPTAASFDRWSQ